MRQGSKWWNKPETNRYWNLESREEKWIQHERAKRAQDAVYDERAPVTRVRVYFLTPEGKEYYQEYELERKRELVLEDLGMAVGSVEMNFGCELLKEEVLGEMMEVLDLRGLIKNRGWKV